MWVRPRHEDFAIGHGRGGLGADHARHVVMLQAACAEPQTLVEGLVAGIRSGRANLRDLTLIGLTYRGVGASPPPYADLALLQSGRLRLKTFFPVAALKEAASAGLVDYVPASFASLPGLIRSGHLRPDVALVQVTPPDAQGRCSFGVAAPMVPALLDAGVPLVAEMNQRMPFTYGVWAPVERLAAIVETDRALIEAPASPPGVAEGQVADQVMRWVRDGATLQLGIGTVTESVMARLTQYRNLGLWGSALVDASVDLLESGAVTNLGRPADPGLTVASVLMGTRRLFDFVDRNRQFELRGIDACNSPQVVSQLRGLVSINAALEVDYQGQVNSETLGGRAVAGAGSVTDFIAGVWQSDDAVSIVALPSATPSGRPRIVPRLAEGTPVTLPRQMAQVVVTEKGSADLRGKSLSERERLLKAIA